MLATALFAEDDCEEAAARLAGTPGSWGAGDARWGPPTPGGITRARERLRRRPPRGRSSTPGGLLDPPARAGPIPAQPRRIGASHEYIAGHPGSWGR